MSDLLAHLPDLLLAYGAYLIATISPGPANIAILSTAMRDGRRAGLQLACGVILGSLIWGILAALGLSAVLLAYGGLAEVVRIAGGAYLLWLAYRSFRSALRRAAPIGARSGAPKAGIAYACLGLAIHLTNPKSIFAWLAIIAIGITPDAPPWIAFAVVGGCWFAGVGIFSGYALVFSTRRMVAIYGSFRRWIDGATALVFGLAGLRLLIGQR